MSSCSSAPERDCPRCGAPTEVGRDDTDRIRECTDPDCIWWVTISPSTRSATQ